MQLEPDKCSVVLIAPWNRALLGPEWMTSRVLVGSQTALELLVGEPFGFRYRTPLVDVVIAGPTLLVHPKTDTKESFDEVERVALSILEKLPETPVRALGLNFGYEVTADGYGVAELDDLVARAAAVTLGPLKIQRVQESFAIDDYIVNVTIMRDVDAKRVTVELNHHADMPVPNLGTAPIAAKRIRGRFLAARTLSERLIQERHAVKRVVS